MLVCVLPLPEAITVKTAMILDQSVSTVGDCHLSVHRTVCNKKSTPKSNLLELFAVLSATAGSLL